MALDVALPAPARSRARSLVAELSTPTLLGTIVVVSFAVRLVAAVARTTPYYFPDEYLYSSLARAIAHGGRPLVRDHLVHFPALLQPLLAAPLWLVGSTELAYRLTQAENALIMSLAALPAYAIAKRLGLSRNTALVCAAGAVASPALVYSSYLTAEPAGYTLALCTVAFGLAALVDRTPRAQAAFVACAWLAVFARIQYVVLPLAFVAASLVLRRPARRALAGCLAPFVLAVAAGPTRLLGVYAGITQRSIDPWELARWVGNDAMLLVFACGVLIVPGALVALARPRSLEERAYSLLVGFAIAGLVAEAAYIAAFDSHRFEERYLFLVAPLLLPAFFLYLRRGRPSRNAVLLLGAFLLALSARVPLSGFAAADGKADSPFLLAVWELERAAGTANGSLAVAGLVALLCAGAAAIATGRLGAPAAAAVALTLGVAASLGAAVAASGKSTELRTTYLPAEASWIDRAGLGDAAVVQTYSAPPDRTLEQLFWNRSVGRELLLGAASPTDVYGATQLRVRSDGALLEHGRLVRSPLLLASYATTVDLQGGGRVATAPAFELWRSGAFARLSVVTEGRSWDGWLAQRGTVTVWPDSSGRVRGTLRVTLALPPTSAALAVHFGPRVVRLRPGESKRVVVAVDHAGRWGIAFHASGGTFLRDARGVSVRSSRPRFERARTSGYTQSLSA